MVEIPDDVDVTGLSAGAVASLAGMLEMQGSLPFIAADVDLSPVSTRVLKLISRVLEDIHLSYARSSPAAFVQYAFRHEGTDNQIVNAPHHEEWHRFLDGGTRSILFSPVEHGKTQHVIGRVLWRLGKDPQKRFAIISNTFEPHATKILSAIRAHIESNPRVKKVFPGLKPSDADGDSWGQARITVQRKTIAKDPSIQALGLFGPVNGARLDGIVLDDILNFENTRTPEQIKKTVDWLDAEVFTRVADHGFIEWIGTPWNPSDPMHEVAKRLAWRQQWHSAVKNPTAPMSEWEPLWPEQFSRRRLIEVYNGTTPINFARKYLCQVRLDHASRFQQAWIDNAKSLGRQYRLSDRQLHDGAGRPLPCFTGVDLGIGQEEGHDLSVLFTVAVEPERRRKIVLEIQAGRWTGPEIVSRIQSAIYRYNSQVFVEDNAAQAFLVQWASQDGLPVRGFTTSAGKKYDEHYGIESIAVEMRNGGWVIPSRDGLHPEVEEWIKEMLFYTPDAHTGDRLMAAWLARECARSAGVPIMSSASTINR
jgi:hypothetical protein